MSAFDILMIGVWLSMDAFAVAMCQGVSMGKLQIRKAFLIALFFGAFQALMPLLGFALGSTVSAFITIGPWIAFAILAFLGIRMLVEGIRQKKDDEGTPYHGLGQLTLLAVATSIDALIVGITFSMQNTIVWWQGGTSIFFAIGLIGLTTLLLSFFGVWIGNRFGLRFRRAATILGGVVLLLIGIKVLLDSFGLFG